MSTNADEEADDPGDEVGEVLVQQLGSLIQIDRDHEYPAFEAADVIAGLLESFGVEHRQGDVQREGDVPIAVLRHGSFPLRFIRAEQASDKRLQ